MERCSEHLRDFVIGRGWKRLRAKWLVSQDVGHFRAAAFGLSWACWSEAQATLL